MQICQPGRMLSPHCSSLISKPVFLRGGRPNLILLSASRWRRHGLRGRRVRHLQRWPSGLLRGVPGSVGGGRCQADGWDGEEVGEGRVHRRHGPRPEVNEKTQQPSRYDCFFFIYCISKPKQSLVVPWHHQYSPFLSFSVPLFLLCDILGSIHLPNISLVVN